jgi:hypothetical protein
VLASSKYALTLMQEPERIGMKGYPERCTHCDVGPFSSHLAADARTLTASTPLS